MKQKYIGQQDAKDCAVSCLYNIIKYYKGNISMSKLRTMLKTDKSGTSVYSVVKTANSLGLISSAYSCELNDLCNLNLPIMAHIKIDKKYDHFIIIDEIIDDEIIIFDPIRGYLKYEIEEFQNEWTNIVITFEKTEKLIKEKDSVFPKILFSHIKKYLNIIILVLLFSIVFSFLSIIHSLYLSYLYDNPNISYKIFILFLFVSITQFILNYVRDNLILKYTKNFDENIMHETHKKILSLPLNYHHSRPVGDIVSRISDLSSIKEFINSISFSFIIDLMYILMINIILFMINKTMFLLLTIMICIYILIYMLYRKNIINLSLITKEEASISNTYLVESILGIDTIKNLNIEDKIVKSFKDKYKRFLNSNFKLNKLIINFDLLQNLISNISCIFVIFIGILLYKNNNISLSYVIAFNSLVVYLFISLKNMISLDQSIINSKNSYIRLKQLYYDDYKTSLNSEKIKSIEKISISKLNYSYDGVNNIINNVNFTINKGDFVFIKGRSGVGKSTIFKIITKVLEIDRNMVKINNIDINDIDRKNIIENICYVSQNEYIFTDTVLNNIKLFEEASKQDLDKVLRITNIDDILKKRNITLDFLLEENGQNLSGGERQRILIARSLLQNKKVLVLDETMNELDIESEKDIIKKIKTEYDVTLILISHRTANSDLFNKIIEI